MRLGRQDSRIGKTARLADAAAGKLNRSYNYPQTFHNGRRQGTTPPQKSRRAVFLDTHTGLCSIVTKGGENELREAYHRVAAVGTIVPNWFYGIVKWLTSHRRPHGAPSHRGSEAGMQNAAIRERLSSLREDERRRRLDFRPPRSGAKDADAGRVANLRHH